MRSILVIDDDKELNDTIREVIVASGKLPVRVDGALFLKDGLKLASENSYDLIFLDIKMPDGNSFDHISYFKGLPDAPEIIIITGGDETDGALLAMKWGVWDYLEKPFRIEELILAMKRALDFRKEKNAISQNDPLRRNGIVGQSPLIREALSNVARISRSDAPVLIQGETGTGKELFAFAIHDNSARRNSPYIVVDCATLPETLVESILFGHVKGSFTGANSSSEGLIKGAHRGTLFLDEVGELTPALQKRLLRVIQEKRFRPIGQKEEVESDFRLVAATNRNLQEMVKRGEFREDLYFRIKSLQIELPPLRERKDDLRELAEYLLKKISARSESPPAILTFEFLECLRYYSWPGNIRELAQVLENAVSLTGPGGKLYPVFLPAEIRYQMTRFLAEKRKETAFEESEDAKGNDPFPDYKEFRNQTLKEAEYQYFHNLLEHTERDIGRACQISGLSRARLYEQLKKAGITGKDQQV